MIYEYNNFFIIDKYYIYVYDTKYKYDFKLLDNDLYLICNFNNTINHNINIKDNNTIIISFIKIKKIIIYFNKISINIIMYKQYNINIFHKIIKYLILGLVILLSFKYIPDLNINSIDQIMISSIGSITFALLDMLSPSININTINEPPKN